LFTSATWFLCLWLGLSASALLLPVGVHAAAVAGPEVHGQPEATLRLLNRDIVTLRASLAGASPQARVDRARARMREVTDADLDRKLETIAFTMGDAKGVQFTLGDAVLFSVLEADVDAEAKQTFKDLVAQTETRLIDARRAWHESRDRPLLLKGLLRAGVATLVLGVLIWGAYVGSRRAVVWMEIKRDRLAAVHDHVDFREFVARMAVGTMVLVQWFVLAALAYTWLRAVLGSFVVTEPLSRGLSDWLYGKVEWVAEGALSSLPGLLTVAIVLVLTRAVVDVLGYFFDAVQKGRVVVPMVHPETTTASRRIVVLLTWGLGIAVAYPFLPGSSSDAFKGLSVVFGLMITLGSTGLVTQAMSGLVVVYSRALRRGDFVEIGDVQGVVTEVAALAIKVVNVRNEEITIPNSVLIGSPIHNYSKLAGSQGTLVTTRVTIGYDTPWRQVHALLIAAANRTEGVRPTPEPFVYQRGLSDFYVEYELFASVDRPMERVPILSRLHANIQDEFNAYGVQIMSPHFFAQPEQAVIVPRAQWHAAPAKAPVDQVVAD
jgi:small-conductance mechanosensitive channel